MNAKDIIKLSSAGMAKRVITASNEVTSQRQKPAVMRHAKGIIRQTPRMGYAKWTQGGGSQVLKKELKRKFSL